MNYALYIESYVPPMFQELYEMLLKSLEEDESRYEQHHLSFRCKNCEDVIEIRFHNIRVIYFYQDFIRLEFDESSSWLSPYTNIDDIWIEKYSLLDENQLTFDDF